MATIVMERIGRLFISIQQVRQVPEMLSTAAPSMPATLRDSEVPCFFRERYIYSGYRPLHQGWRYYFFSLFQWHNETVNVWTHLLGALLILVKWAQLAETVDFVRDPHAWPLLILLQSSLSYTLSSAVAHLLAGKSELSHYMFFYLDYVGVAQYQYGSAVVHFYYAVEEDWHGCVQGFFMPTACLLCCLSCLGCCYGKYRNHSLPPWVRKVSQVIPSSVAYMWDTSPVFHRLLFWPTANGFKDSSLIFHFGQVAFFLSSAFFFTQPLPERWFPGHCDFLGQGHQLFHVFLLLCTLCQIQASYLDYVARRTLYVHLHRAGEAAFFVALYVATLVSCAFIAAFMFRKVRQLLNDCAKSK
ncbi:progestin and adipoQ receptor family member VII, a [Hypomesus transpacificus]|uniref:progestin and adipoQ receptor family member VII, a n=1 Tax=Hypomesus transpacificus TaxID=137520 RepID=UPI001F07219C|nr:progestin and adipoQ receptor family member VII, a [Hypomesus transpacificus]XP_046875016.1 progestin and adipoQ receptor family member VII, a [Hypomesus transpacificus]XP_046875017.1 progestin and adipoQ receptor family member VII, a [Hypomesus transpacificus]